MRVPRGPIEVVPNDFYVCRETGLVQLRVVKPRDPGRGQEDPGRVAKPGDGLDQCGEVPVARPARENVVTIDRVELRSQLKIVRLERDVVPLPLGNAVVPLVAARVFVHAEELVDSPEQLPLRPCNESIFQAIWLM